MIALRRLAIALALLAALMPFGKAWADDAPPAAGPTIWHDLANGRFFTSGDDELGLTGFAVIDDAPGPPFWRSYQLLGGLEMLGTPLTRPFILPDAHVYQLFQYAMLRWRPGAATADIAETLDLMRAAGRDEWLAANGVPHAVPLDEQAALTRIGWLTDDALRDTYFGATYPDSEPGLAAALLRYGLPAAQPERDDTGVTQRFDRAALRLDFATGAVAALPVGALLNRSGLMTHTPQTPDRLVGGQLVTRAPRVSVGWPSSRGWGVPDPLAMMQAAEPGVGTPGGPAAVPIPVPAPASPMTPAPTPTSTPPSAPSPTAPGATPSPRTTPAAAPPVPGAILVIKAIVNQGRAEHVVIANDGSAPQELTGWTLRSGAGGQQLSFPAGFVLQPAASVRVHSGSGASSQNRPPTDLFATSANVWNNQGDSALLVDPTGRVVHQLAYGG